MEHVEITLGGSSRRRGGKRGRKRKNSWGKILALAGIFFVFGGLTFAAMKVLPKTDFLSKRRTVASISEVTTEPTTAVPTTENAEAKVEKLLEDAKRLAASYDYDTAIEMLKADAEVATQEKVAAAIAEFEQTKTTLVRADINKVPHVFFHTLIYDTAKAFDGDSKEAGYNEVMTTIDEFNKMLEIMHSRGYVLVGLHDMAREEDDPESGTKKMVAQSIMLPEGKKPIVFSQDDVCYYEYMEGDGFANRLVIGEDGRVTTEMDMEDGTKQVGDFDLIPILNKFIDEHPDFSYQGAKAIIAVTGYNGVFGYRTDASYEGKNPNIEADRQKVREIADALRADGWELASHSWGHKHLGRIEMDKFYADCDKWQDNVEALIGETDILLYPFGTDVADWHPYTDDNERYVYLRDQGFRYFCTVDANEYWVQKGDNWLRQGRRNLDGYRMWRDITEPEKPRLKDLFDSNEVFDKARPTPVGVIRS